LSSQSRVAAYRPSKILLSCRYNGNIIDFSWPERPKIKKAQYITGMAVNKWWSAGDLYLIEKQTLDELVKSLL
jgi:hypothetical protein